MQYLVEPSSQWRETRRVTRQWERLLVAFMPVEATALLPRACCNSNVCRASAS